MKHTIFMRLFAFLFSIMLFFASSVISVFATFSPPSSHDAPTLKFEHINARLGLNQNTITRLFVDTAGLMWIGTQDGLHLYNGKNFHLFDHDANDPTTISEGFVTDIVQDSKGNIWVATLNNGLNKLDLKSGRFTHFKQDQGLEDLRVNRLSIVGDTLWVGTKTGLYSLSSRKNTLTQVPLGNSIIPNVTSLANAGDDYLIVGTENNGIFSIGPNTINRLNLPQGLKANQIKAIDNTTIYAALSNQLWQYDITSRQGNLIWQRPSKKNNLSEIKDFILGDHDEFWLVGPNSGLVKLVPQDNSSTVDLKKTSSSTAIKAYAYRHDPFVQGSIVDNNIQSLLLDDNGVLWLGTHFAGINKVNIERQYFQHMYEQLQLNPRQSNNIRALFRSRNGTLWIGTEGAGVKSLSPGNQFYQHYSSYFTNAASPTDLDITLRVLDITQDAQDNVWIASSLGLGRLSATGTFSLYQQSDLVIGALGNGLIRSLHVDASGQLWVSADSRLFKYQPKDDDFIEFDLSNIVNFDASHNNIMVMRSQADTLWLGTMNGLIKWDMATSVGELFVHVAESSQSIANNRVRDILIDGNDLWIASHGGITQISTEHGKYTFTQFDKELGLTSNTVYALLFDVQKNVWFSSNAGISRFNPATKKVITFNESEGLQGLEFNGKVKLKDENGQLWFGGINGINHFNPESIPKKRAGSKLALAGYSIAGNYKRLLDLRQPPTITMQYDNQVISFDVVSLDFSYSDKDQFAFMLEGADSQWRNSNSSSDITYTNLTPGNYTLNVRYGLQNNPLNDQVLSVPLLVTAPIYRSSYAYLFYTLLLLFIITKVIGDKRKKQQQQHEFESSIKVSAERLKLALWASGDGMWDWNINEDKVFRTDITDSSADTKTYKATGTDLVENIHPEDKARVILALSDHLKGRTPFYESEYRRLNEEGQWVWLLDRGKVVEFDGEGQPLRMTGTQKDITSRKTAENELRLSSQVLQSMNEAVVVAGLDYKMISVNPAFSLVTGFSAKEVMNKPFLYLTRGQKNRTFYEAIEKQLLHNKRWSGEIAIRTKRKRKILIWLEINQVIDMKQEASHFVAVFTDITDRKKAEEDLRVLANFDTLTGLPNRTLFQDRLSHAIHQAYRSKKIVALLFLDLDRFKHINDSMGHHVGDLLLKAVANRLKNSIREGDTVARLGGDEFTIILEGVNKNKVATIISEKLIRAFQTPFLLDDKVLTISPSIGISIYPEDAQDSTSLIKYADTAMYHAKSLGRNNFQFYTSKLNEYAVRHVELEAGLKQAIARNEFSLVYQPKFCVSTGNLTGLEALLRWQNGELGSISPAEFIPLAEETGMINEIGHWVINHACNQIALWHELGFTSLNVAVNLSANQLKADIVSTIEVALAVSGLPAHALELELTESMIMKNPQDSVAALNQLKALGLTLAVDDFGTGYSSLSYLKRFPIDTLKIDREFVGDITDDPDDAAITSAIIALGHSLDLKVVAEGVETQEQLNFLAQHQCDQIQGYLLSKPLNAADCQAFLYRQKVINNTAS